MADDEKRDWNSTAAGWKKWHAVSEKAAQSATENMLDMAGVSEGDRVIDFATGLGDTAIACARRVGDAGYVYATDASVAMLEFAEEYASGHGLTNVSFGRADFNDLVVDENGFDAGICRWGLMFATDLVASLRSIRSLLRPGGTFAAIVWGPSERVEVHTLSNTVLMETLGEPPIPTGKGTPFALCDREELEGNFASAGFTNVESQVVSVVHEFPSAEDYAGYRKERSSIGKRIAHRSKADQDRAWAAVVHAAHERARPDHSVRFVSETIVVAGQNAVQQYF